MIRTLFTLAAIFCAHMTFTSNQCHAVGNLSVELSEEGLLSIQGDRESNHCIILVIDGVTRVFGDPTTTINGSQEHFIRQTNDVRDIAVILGDGNDFLAIACYDILVANMNIDTGRGRDGVSLSGAGILGDLANYNEAAAVYGDVSVNTGGQSDNVSFSSLAVTGRTSVSTGNGDDTLLIAASDMRDNDQNSWIAIPCEFGDELKINTGEGDDTIRFAMAYQSGDVVTALIDSDLEIQCGQGNDLISHFRGFDTVIVDGKALLSGGQGVDLCDHGLILADEFLKIGFED